VEPWAAIVIGIVAGILFCIFPRILAALNIDDPVEASSVHYINGVWGCIAVAIFDSTRGFISGSDQMGQYFGV
jgi:Amt family ammonium transporter